MPVWRNLHPLKAVAEAITVLGHGLLGPDPGEDAPKRKWRLWQVETALACNLNCVMCPWTAMRQGLGFQGLDFQGLDFQDPGAQGLMAPEVWQALAPHLHDAGSVDFSGGGEPLLQPRLFDWIGQAKAQGCDTGFLTNGLLLSESVVSRILALGMTWIGISVDGADKATYEGIRRGSNFDLVCRNIRYLTRQLPRPRVLINFVIMKSNAHQLAQMVDLAQDLGVDQLNFKQCDVIRGDHGRGLGLFGATLTREAAPVLKALEKARKKARKLGLKTTAFSFTPEELPVCAQDPRSSLFIGVNGRVSPCINLAMGGPSVFLGKAVEIPRKTFGCLPAHALPKIWENEDCRFFRERFDQRLRAHDAYLASADIGHDLIKMKTAFQEAIRAMPPAPDGCQTCHYLYGV